MSSPVRWVLRGVSRVDARSRLAERVAEHLRPQLPDDHVLLPRYAPRDHGERIAVVVVGRQRVFVIEPREDEGAIVCYQDHWYRRIGPGMAQPIGDAPSLRARRNRERIRSDLGTGGFINVAIEPLVLLTRGHPDDVRSSCVPVISGIDALARHIVHGIDPTPAPEHTRAVANALAHNITLVTV